MPCLSSLYIYGDATHTWFCLAVKDLSPEEDLERAVRRMNFLLIVLVVEFAPIALLAAYFLVMFVLHPPFVSGD